MKSLFLKTTLCTALLGGFVTVVLAQKTDETQGFSRFAPPTIKIDGKNFEWKDIDFSVNKRTGLSYVICNDDKNLYLVIKSTDVENNTKIMAGGITFSVNPDGKKKEKESISLTYPFVDQVRSSSSGAVVVSSSPMRKGLKDPMRDSIRVAGQKKKLERAKEIKINGFKNTSETLISIYNEYGIKTFANIEKDNSFFYELAIPLEALGVSVAAPTELAYNVKVNGLQMPGLDNREIVVGPPGGGSAIVDVAVGSQALTSSTDFWGKYTLAKH
ncbi:hypothetical protein [Pedobacter nyackensis]|nr:hypothetical protein [Pedobacter nyackensis]